MAACLAFSGTPKVATDAGGAETVRIVAYNLHNYSLQPSKDARSSPAKSEREIVAMVAIIAELRPDILGVCEMGSEEDLGDLQQRLKSAEVDLPHREYVNGPDGSRHLALLSRYPMVARQSQAHLHYLMDETLRPLQRGLLDVTVEVHSNYQLRLIGLHLKSQRDTVEADQSMMRRQEAHVVRRYLDGILQVAPQTNVLVYGDLNESKDQPGIREIRGPVGSPMAFRDLTLADDAGEKWTFYHEPTDEYSRLDYVLASPGVSPEVRLKQSGIFGGKEWNEASDHRPLFVTIVPVDQRSP